MDDKYANTISPFSGQKIDTANIFATGDKRGQIGEFLRGLSDNLSIGEHTTLDTDTGMALVKKLNGAHFKRLMAHSNGATVTESSLKPNRQNRKQRESAIVRVTFSCIAFLRLDINKKARSWRA